MDEIIAEFVTETQDSLNDLDNALIVLEDNPKDQALLNQIFRILHTVKGTCGFLGFMRLEKIAHITETLLDQLRNGEKTASQDDIGLILTSLDRIRMLVDRIGADGSEPDGSDDSLIAELEQATAGQNSAPQDIDKKIITEEHIKTPDNESHDASASSSPQYLRVNVGTLEDMLTKVSELVLTRNQIVQLTKTLPEEAESILSEPFRRLNSVVSELQDSVMKARMQPIGSAWAKFPRIIHDIAREQGKKIHLEMRGENTEVDRQVLELIKDPLMHMVRNAADHGIEKPDARLSHGKGESGHITLSAWHEGGYIIIQIRDDGKGIDPERIKETILKRALATDEQLEALSNKQILDYIFAPGFSTAETVTSVSGRGVGMDVVRNNIEKIGGTIDLDSTPGHGSRFTIRIPLTLAIISALIIGSGGRRYALPQINVQEVLRISPQSEEQVEMVSHHPVLRFREQLLPLVSMRTLLNDTTDGWEEEDFKHCYIIVVRIGSLLFGMIVDNIYDTEEIVVKPVASILKSISYFSGNTILGDGQVIMILDPSGISREAKITALQSDHVLHDPANDNLVRHSSMLIFSAMDQTPKAVPSFLVARIEEFPRDHIEQTNGHRIIQYQGKLMDLHMIGDIMPDHAQIKSLIFCDDQTDSQFGIMIDDVVDIVDAELDINPSGARPGFLGTAIISGQATEILDVNYFTGVKDWMPDISALNRNNAKQSKILVVEDSAFFRHMLQPFLNMAGYDVTMTDQPEKALAMHDRGDDFDLIVSDIEMGDMSGLDFAEAVRKSARWRNVPMVALSSRSSQQDIALGYAKGFSAYIAKTNRDSLLSTIENMLDGHKTQESAI